MNLLQQQKWTEAEMVLPSASRSREAAARRLDDVRIPSRCSAAHSWARKSAEAEPLLLVGYDGMKKREATIPTTGKVRLTDALERLVQLYEATGKKDEAARCARNSLAKAVQSSKAAKQP